MISENFFNGKHCYNFNFFITIVILKLIFNKVVLTNYVNDKLFITINTI